MKKIILLTFSIIAILVLVACGGSSDTKTQSNSTNIPIEACITPPVISSYQTLKSGDTIIDDTQASTINTYHDVDNVKRICVLSGEAHISRIE